MSTRQPRFLTNEECSRFMKGLIDLPTHERAYLLVLFLTGARPSEARCLEWADLDLDQRLWRKRSVTHGAGAYLVPLPAQIIDAFASLSRQTPWVFPGTNGEPWSAYRVTTMWRQFCKGIDLNGLTLSILRRTCAMRLAVYGRPEV